LSALKSPRAPIAMATKWQRARSLPPRCARRPPFETRLGTAILGRPSSRSLHALGFRIAAPTSGHQMTVAPAATASALIRLARVSASTSPAVATSSAGSPLATDSTPRLPAVAAADPSGAARSRPRGPSFGAPPTADPRSPCRRLALSPPDAHRGIACPAGRRSTRARLGAPGTASAAGVTRARGAEP
jgi:hypothetical protein